MRVRHVLLVCFSVLILLCQSCSSVATTTGSSGPGDSTIDELLITLLGTVPFETTGDIVYNNLLVLSEEHGVQIPAAEASFEEKSEWWRVIQDNILYGFPYPIAPDVWGFDATNIDAMLTLFDGTGVTVLAGDPNVAKVVEKFRYYNYRETQYRNMPVFVWTPESTDEVVRLLPRAIGVIDGVMVEGEPLTLIVMAGLASPGIGASECEELVKISIEAYQEGTSLANGTWGVSAIARHIGKAGGAYFSDNPDPVFKQITDSMTIEDRERARECVGPGNLQDYSEDDPSIAIVYRRENGHDILEFVLWMPSASAEANKAVMKRRLTEGRSYTLDKSLSELFSIQEVEADGPHLRASVKLIGEAAQNPRFFVNLVYTRDYWFLRPGQYRWD